jgi:hypothetical protein
MNKLGDQVIQVIKDQEFQNITKDIVEIGIDSVLDEGIVKDIPLLSTVIGVFKTASNLQDRLFINKLLTFLYQLKSKSEDDILEQIIKIEDSHKYKTKVGEKLLYIIDKCEDLDKAAFTGTFFKAFLEKKIDYDTFLTGASIIDKTPLPDLQYFLNEDFQEIPLDSGGSLFVSYGLMEINVTKPKIKVKSDSYQDDERYIPSEDEIMEQKITITDFRVTAQVSWIGDEMRTSLRTQKAD